MSAILSIANRSGQYPIDSDTMLRFMEKIFPDKAILRKLKYIWHETSIEKKYTAIRDFNADCTDPCLYKGNGDPTTSERLGVFDTESILLGKEVSLEAIKRAQVSANDITHIITVSCTGMSAPGLESRLVEELTLQPNVKRFTVNFMGCYAAFHAMRLADLICTADPKSKVLVVCVELCTLHLRNDSSDDNLLSTALFSDGASAFIIGKPFHNNLPYLECKSFESVFIPQGKQDMAWNIGDHGFEMVLNRNIPAHIENNMAQTFDTLLKNNSIKSNDIVHYAIHPGGKNILKAFERSLNLGQNQLEYSYSVLRHFGNMSSVTVMFVLEQFLENFIESDRDQYVYSAAFGPGLTIENGLFILKAPIS